MKQARVLFGALALSSVCVIGGTAASASATPATHTEVVSDCLSAHYKPTSVDATCGDANFVVQHLTYSTWTLYSATGRGVAAVNNCKPNCAEGHVHYYQAHVVLEKMRVVKGQPLFRVMNLTFPGNNPYGQAHQHFVLPTHGL